MTRNRKLLKIKPLKAPSGSSREYEKKKKKVREQMENCSHECAAFLKGDLAGWLLWGIKKIYHTIAWMTFMKLLKQRAEIIMLTNFYDLLRQLFRN